METLGASGNVAEALQVYEELRCLLRDELGVTPAPEVQALHQRLLAAEPVREPVRTIVRAAIAPGPTRYARHGEMSLAYQVLGEGPTTLLLVTGWVLPMEAIWEDPAYVRFVERLASSFRVILWDKRGTGLSDRVAVDRLPTLEERMDDIGAVLDAAGAERAVIAGLSEGAVLSALFGAARPGSTRRRWSSMADWRTARIEAGQGSAPGRPGRRRFDEFADEVQRSWDDMGPFLALWAPTHEHDPVVRDWWTRALHRGASPASAVAWLRMLADFDIRAAVGAIHTPTLVMHRTGDRMIRVENGRWLGANIPGAEYVELAGDDHLWWLGDQDALLDELERFLAVAAPAREPDRVLATVLFTDIVDSTTRAGELGDRRWRDLMARHEAIVRDRLGRWRGREVERPGDGFLATFDGPARAIPMRRGDPRRDATARRRAANRAAHRRDRAGGGRRGRHRRPHRRQGGVDGGSRRGAVSRTVGDLVARLGIEFEGRGTHDLHGVAEEWHLYALATDWSSSRTLIGLPWQQHLLDRVARAAAVRAAHQHAHEPRVVLGRLEAHGHLRAQRLDRLLLAHADDAAARAGHADVGDVGGPAGQDARVGGRHVGVRAHDGGHAAVEVPAHARPSRSWPRRACRRGRGRPCPRARPARRRSR